MLNVTLVSVMAHSLSLQHACVPGFSGTGATVGICPNFFPLISRGFTVRMLSFLASCARGVFFWML